MFHRRTIQKSRILVLSVLTIGLLSCSTVRSPERPLDYYDIVLLPTEDFSFDFAAQLAKILASDTGLRIRAVLNLGTKDWSPYENAPQYDPEKLKDIALPAIAQLKNSYGGSLYILLTTRDINSSEGNLRFVFAESYPQDKVSVISTARMHFGASPQVVSDRLRKMTLRTIGLQYYGLPRSADPQDLLYSPLMGLDALDAMEPILKH